MLNLRSFLRKFKCTNKDTPNIGSLKGGLWKIPKEQSDAFLTLFCRASLQFTPAVHTAFVFRPPKTRRQPFLLDLDFQTEQTIPLPLELYKAYARVLATELQRKLEIPIAYIIVTKQTGYFKLINKQNVYKTGCHLYFVNALVDLAVARELRSFAVKAVRPIFGTLSYCNGDDDVVDFRIPGRKNGLMFINDYKPGGCGGQYKIRVAASLIEGRFLVDDIDDEKFETEFHQYMPLIYNFIFEEPEEEPAPTTPTPPAA